jgi:hypothetical protein
MTLHQSEFTLIIATLLLVGCAGSAQGVVGTTGPTRESTAASLASEEALPTVLLTVAPTERYSPSPNPSATMGIQPTHTAVASATTAAPALSETPPCAYQWFFETVSGLCAEAAPTSSTASLEHFEHGMMIWHGSTYVVLTEIPHWFDGWNKAYLFYDPLNAERDTSSEVGTPPSGVYAPILGFGIIWRGDYLPGEAENRDYFRNSLGWATEPEFTYTMTSQCSVATHPSGSGNVCYLTLPDGSLIQVGTDHYGNADWAPG